MRVKEREETWLSTLPRLRSRPFLLWMAVTGALLLTFAAGVEFQRRGLTRRVGVRAVQALRAGGRLLHRFRVTTPELHLDVKHPDFVRIAFERERALEAGLHLPQPGDWVPARMRQDGEWIPIRIRLKGTSPNHWADDHKWSLSVRVRGDRAFMGMRRFTLQDPQARSYIFEWLFQRALSREGLIASRFGFLRLKINGDDRGIYAFEEHYDRMLIENNRHRDGPIVSFSKDLNVLSTIRAPAGLKSAYAKEGDAFWDSPIEGSQVSRISGDDAGFDLLEKAVALLESFRTGEQAASEVFEIDEMAKAMALRVLFRSNSFDWRNTKFYFNPITSRLHPVDQEINNDRFSDWWLNEEGAFLHNELIARLFEDDGFYLAYIRELERISSPGYVEEFLEEVAVELEANVGTLYWELWEHPRGTRFDREHFEVMRKTIRQAIYPLKIGHAFLEGKHGDVLRLNVGNLQLLPVEIVGLSSGEPSGGTSEAAFRSRPAGASVLKGRRGKVVSYETIEFAVPGTWEPTDAAVEELKLECRVRGTSETQRIPVYPWFNLRTELLRDDPRRRAPNMGSFEFVLVDEARREATLRRGRWKLDTDLIVPAGYSVLAGGGVALDLSSGASIVSYSPLRWVGSDDEPVVVESTDGTGSGIVVIGAEGRSRLESVVFRNLSQPDAPGAGLTGAITFYESDVTVEDCRLLENREGDDSLNAIRSDVEIVESSFSGSRRDALDLDFCTGRIVRTLFVDSGNDAIDVSGTHIELEDVTVMRAGDKGISAGEGSSLRGERITITGADVAVASKDLSTVELTTARIEGARVGFAVYQKKREFGPGAVTVSSVEMRDLETPHIVETDSELTIDGRRISGTAEDVEATLYGDSAGEERRED